jgi:RNA polymerase sigma-B factor
VNDQKHKRLSNADTAPKETAELFKKYARNRDPATRDALILGHQNLVHYLAGKFANRGIPLEDLVQVGMIGLINAVDRFDPDRGLQFSTYATPTILGEIRRHFRDKGWGLKVPRRLQELNMAAAKTAEKIGAELGRPPTIQEVATRIGASEEETLEAIEMGNAYEMVALDAPMQSQGESAMLTLSDFLGKEDASLHKIEFYGDLREAINSLEPREKAIIYYRFFKELSQTQVATRLNISQMHVSRLQHRAMRKLKEFLEVDDD